MSAAILPANRVLNREQPPPPGNCCSRSFGSLWTLVNGGSDGLKATLKVVQYGSLAGQAVSMFHSNSIAKACGILSSKSAGVRSFVENFDFIEDWSLSSEERQNIRDNQAFGGIYEESYLNTAQRVFAFATDLFNRLSNILTPICWIIDNGLVKIGERLTRICAIAGTAFTLLFYGFDIISRLAQQKLLADTLSERRQGLLNTVQVAIGANNANRLINYLDSALQDSAPSECGEVISQNLQSYRISVPMQNVIHRYYQNKQKGECELKKNWVAIAASATYVALMAITGLVVSATLPFVVVAGLTHAIFNVAKCSYNNYTVGNWTPRLV